MTETRISAVAIGAISAVTARSAGRGNPGRNNVFSRAAVDLTGFVFAVRPESDFVAAAATERQRDRGSPCAGTKYNDPAHAGFLSWVRAPKRFSVPVSEAANVLVVLEDDQERNNDLRGDVGCGFFSAHHEPCKYGKAGSAEN